LLQALSAAQPAGARVGELERLADATLLEPDVVRLTEGHFQAGLTEQRFTTRDMLATESALIEGALERRDSRVAVTSMRTLERTLVEYTAVSPEQRDLVRGLCRRGDGVAVVRAPAGTGKTFALDAARQAWHGDRVEVLGCALSARAAHELRDQSAIPTTTIAAVRGGLEQGRELPRRSVLVVDEAGMVGTRALAELAAAARRAQAKLVLVGDDRQLPEIQAGGAFRALAQRLDALELHEVRRQREPWDREALDALRCGQVERWARAYRDAGRITVARSAIAARTALINDRARADGDKLIIAARRSDVRDLNARARQLRWARGELGPDAIEIAGRGYAVGDQVIATRNDRQLGVINGQRATVKAVDARRETIEVAIGASVVALDAAYLRAGHLDHGYAITAHRAQGATVDRAFVLDSDELYREWGLHRAQPPPRRGPLLHRPLRSWPGARPSPSARSGRRGDRPHPWTQPRQRARA
jgi:ATP-dependent exoDNAse (exonuclease V) alpha subunit